MWAARCCCCCRCRVLFSNALTDVLLPRQESTSVEAGGKKKTSNLGGEIQFVKGRDLWFTSLVDVKEKKKKKIFFAAPPPSEVLIARTDFGINPLQTSRIFSTSGLMIIALFCQVRLPCWCRERLPKNPILSDKFREFATILGWEEFINWCDWVHLSSSTLFKSRPGKTITQNDAIAYSRFFTRLYSGNRRINKQIYFKHQTLIKIIFGCFWNSKIQVY